MNLPRTSIPAGRARANGWRGCPSLWLGFVAFRGAGIRKKAKVPRWPFFLGVASNERRRFNPLTCASMKIIS